MTILQESAEVALLASCSYAKLSVFIYTCCMWSKTGTKITKEVVILKVLDLRMQTCTCNKYPYLSCAHVFTATHMNVI